MENDFFEKCANCNSDLTSIIHFKEIDVYAYTESYCPKCEPKLPEQLKKNLTTLFISAEDKQDIMNWNNDFTLKKCDNCNTENKMHLGDMNDQTLPDVTHFICYNCKIKQALEGVEEFYEDEYYEVNGEKV